MVARTYTLDEILSLIGRRRWLILIPFALGVAAAPLLARYAPERYRSEALILVIPQRVPDNYVKPTVRESAAERLPSITDQSSVAPGWSGSSRRWICTRPSARGTSWKTSFSGCVGM